MHKERINKLDVTLTQEECKVLYKCAEILYELANCAEDEELNALMHNGIKYDAYEWLNNTGSMLEQFADKTISITE